MILPWYYHDTAMVLPWYCLEKRPPTANIPREYLAVFRFPSDIGTPVVMGIISVELR